jgi:hypothetical protein
MSGFVSTMSGFLSTISGSRHYIGEFLSTIGVSQRSMSETRQNVPSQKTISRSSNLYYFISASRFFCLPFLHTR